MWMLQRQPHTHQKQRHCKNTLRYRYMAADIVVLMNSCLIVAIDKTRSQLAPKPPNQKFARVTCHSQALKPLAPRHRSHTSPEAIGTEANRHQSHTGTEANRSTEAQKPEICRSHMSLPGTEANRSTEAYRSTEALKPEICRSHMSLPGTEATQSLKPTGTEAPKPEICKSHTPFPSTEATPRHRSHTSTEATGTEANKHRSQ